MVHVGQVPMVQAGHVPIFQAAQVPMAQQPVQAAPAANDSQYKTVTPIAALGRSSAPVDCPSCGKRTLTATTFIVGTTTQ